MEDRIKKITIFAEKHTDEQCGLDVAHVHVFDYFGQYKPITILVSAKDKRKHRGMSSEWRDQAEDLIKEIGGDPGAGYGGLGIKFELQAASDTHFQLREIE